MGTLPVYMCTSKPYLDAFESFFTRLCKLYICVKATPSSDTSKSTERSDLMNRSKNKIAYFEKIEKTLTILY